MWRNNAALAPTSPLVDVLDSCSKTSAVVRSAHVQRQSPSLEFDNLNAPRPNRNSLPKPDLAVKLALRGQLGGKNGCPKSSFFSGPVFLPGRPYLISCQV